MIALIITLILASSAWGQAEGQGGTETPPVILSLVTEASVHEAVEAYVQERLAGLVDPQDRVTVSTRWQGDFLLDRPGQAQFHVVPLSSRPFRGPSVVRVELVIGAETVKTLTLTVDTRIHRPVLVTAQALRRGTPLTSDMVQVEERDITSLADGFFTDLAQLDGWQTRRPIGVSDILTRRHVEPVPVITRGDEVLLVTETANMQLSVRGVAMQDGGIGSRIRVKNADSGKVLSGLIVDAATVRIGS